jgi:hypothetical protein
MRNEKVVCVPLRRNRNPESVTEKKVSKEERE